MYSSVWAGQMVQHERLGPGEVIRAIRGGRFLIVRFEGGTAPVQVAREELLLADEQQPAPAEPVPLEGDDSALRTLEALRLGVVPSQGVEFYTVGRQTEMAAIERDLGEAEGVGSARVVLGDYGTGKTHLLECIESLALERRFLVSRLVLDDEEVAPSHPKRVYRALVRGLRYPDDPSRRGLEPLLRAAAEGLPASFLVPGSPEYHRYLSPVVAYYRELHDLPSARPLLETMLDWLEGHPSLSNRELDKDLRRATRLPGHRLFAMMDYRTWAHVYAYIVGGIAHLARECGYRGVAVLFDEAEFYSLLSTSVREFADLLFGYYAAAALGPERVRFDLAGARRGGHPVHRGFPPRYQETQAIYCVFAMTDDPDGLDALARILTEDRFSCLSPLRLEDYQELCRRVVQIYRRAHPQLVVGDEVQMPMGQVVYRGVERGCFENPRQVLKFVLELLDFTRLRPLEIPDYIREVLAFIRG